MAQHLQLLAVEQKKIDKRPLTAFAVGSLTLMDRFAARPLTCIMVAKMSHDGHFGHFGHYRSAKVVANGYVDCGW